MISGLKRKFGKGWSVNYAELVENGAQVIDVRTKEEFKYGHVEGSKNIPLQTLTAKTGRLNKQKAIITCCATGVRSANAKSILKSKGFEEVYNGGGWLSLNNKLKK